MKKLNRNSTKRNSTFVFLSLVLSVFLIAGLVSTAGAADVLTGTSTATIEFTKGDLVLVQASSFDFGDHAIDVNTSEYSVTAVDQPVIVEDSRGPNGAWQLTVQLDTFDGASDSLPGAEITLDSGAASTVSGGNGTSPSCLSSISVVAGGSAADVTNVTGWGIGKWSFAWAANNANTKIEIDPADATVGQHVADMNWVLNDAP